MPQYFGGIDWTRHTREGRTTYGVALAAVADEAELSATFHAARQVCALPTGATFHAYEDSPDIQLALLKAVLFSPGVHVRIGALFYEPAASAVDAADRLRPPDLMHTMAVRLLRDFLPSQPLKKLHLDRDIEGRKRQSALKKDVRALRKGLGVDHSPDMSFRSRQDSELVQLADAFAYNLLRYRRNAKAPKYLTELLGAISGRKENVILEIRELEG